MDLGRVSIVGCLPVWLILSAPSFCRVQTSYVTVEPKRRKQQQSGQEDPRQRGETQAAAMGEATSDQPPTHGSSRQRGSGGGRELRRARIVITVKRTEDYERWLEENPLQAIIAGDDDEGGAEPVAV